MAENFIVVTALPNGIVDGRARITAFVSPRLEDGTFAASPFRRWTERLRMNAPIDQARNEITLKVAWTGGSETVTGRLSLRDDLWDTLFSHVTSPAVTAAASRPFELYSAAVVNAGRMQAALVRHALDRSAAQVILRRSARVNSMEAGAGLERAGPMPARARVELEDVLAGLDLYVAPLATTQQRDAAVAAENALRAAATATGGEIGRKLLRDFGRVNGDGTRLPKAETAYDIMRLHGQPVPVATAGDNVVNAATQMTRLEERRTALATNLAYLPRNAIAYEPAFRAAAPDPEPVTFDEILTRLGNFPALYRSLGLAFDVEFDASKLTPVPANQRLIWFDLPPLGGLTVRAPKTWFDIDAPIPARGRSRFVAAGRDHAGRAPRISGGLLDLQARDSANRAFFTLQATDVVGTHIKLTNEVEARNRATEYRTETSETRKELPSERTDGIEVVLNDRAAVLAASDRAVDATYADRETEREALLQANTLTLWADDLLTGFRVDVHDGKAWRSLNERVAAYTFGQPPSDAVKWKPMTPEEIAREEGVIEIAATEMLDDPTQGHLLEALFKWDNWSLSVPPSGKAMNDDDTSDGGSEGRMRVRAQYKVKPRSLPPLRFGTQYRFRLRYADLAGNGPQREDIPTDDLAMALPGTAQPAFVYQRAEPLSPPSVLLSRALHPNESPGEQIDRLVVRAETGSGTDRILVPPRMPQREVEIHGSFDGGLTKGAFQGVWLTRDGTFPNARLLERRYGRAAPPDPAADNAVFHFSARDPEPVHPYYPDPFAREVCLLVMQPDGGVLARINPHLVYTPRGYEWPEAIPFAVRVERGSRDRVSWRWNRTPYDPDRGTTPLLLLKLRRWETLYLVVSSGFGRDATGRANLERMRLWNLAPAGQDAISSEIQCGDHEMYSPPRALKLVHAAKKPPAPILSNLAAARRAYGDTGAAFSAVAASTIENETPLQRGASAIEVHASWTDPIDDPQQDKQGERTDGGLVVNKRITLLDSSIRLEAIHEMRDTRYHRVRFTPVATSGFQEYYQSGKPEEFQAKGEPIELEILSSARPAPLNVDRLTPAFRWDEDDGMIRHAGGLRVYLDRPWFLSGAGEMLGVVLGGPGALPPGLEELISRCGSDPIWKTDRVAKNLTVDQFRKGDTEKSVYGWTYNKSLHLAEFAAPEVAPGRPAVAATACGGPEVTVLGYKPVFDTDDQRWYCDLEIDPGSSYFPFVQLALVRLQPKSLSCVEISEVVLADFAQLTPRRQATVVRKGNRVEVTVRGTTYQTQDDTKKSVVRMRLEEHHGARGYERGWVPTIVNGRPVEITVKASGSAPTWRGELQRPGRWFQPDRRIVVEEYEVHNTDAQPAGGNPETNPNWRLVFTAAIPL